MLVPRFSQEIVLIGLNCVASVTINPESQGINKYVFVFCSYKIQCEYLLLIIHGPRQLPFCGSAL